MHTECTSVQMEFQGLGRRRVEADFDGGYMSSDGGALLLWEANLRARGHVEHHGVRRHDRRILRIEREVHRPAGAARHICTVLPSTFATTSYHVP